MSQLIAHAQPTKEVVMNFQPQIKDSPDKPAALPEMIRKKTNAAMLRTNAIEPDPNQPRKHFDQSELEQLASSIKTHGLINPILVRKNESSPGKYILVAGERRWQAHQLAKLETIDVLILERDLDERERRALQFAENKERANLSLIEEALFFKEEMEVQKCPARQLARCLNLDVNYITTRVKLLNLPEDVQKQLEDHHIGPMAAYRLTMIDDVEELRETVQGLIDGNITPTSLREMTTKGNSQKKSSGNKSKQWRRNGVNISISSSKRVTYGDWANELEKLAKELRQDGRTRRAA